MPKRLQCNDTKYKSQTIFIIIRGNAYLIKVDRNQSTDFCFSEHCVDQNDLTEVDGNQWFDEPCKHCDAAMQITNRGPDLMMQPPPIANVLQKNVGVHQYSEDWTPDTWVQIKM